MNPYLYCLALLELNKSHFGGYIRCPSFFSAVAFGLLEEMAEFKVAVNSGDRDRMVKEAGDVLAYVTLVVGSIYTVHESTFEEGGVYFFEFAVNEIGFKLEYAALYNSTRTLEEMEAEVAGNFKRFYRENQVLNSQLALEALSVVIRDSGFTFEEIAEVNISKLRDRHERGTMLAGSGDSR